jgi:hypothetical protein
MHAKSSVLACRRPPFNGRSQSPLWQQLHNQIACKVPFDASEPLAQSRSEAPDDIAGHLRLQSPFRLILADVAVSSDCFESDE